jgi:hypothetical protein
MPRGRATGTLQGSGVRVVRPTGWCRGQEDGPKGVTRRLDWYPPGAWEDGSPYHAPRVGRSSEAGAVDCSGRSGVWCQLHEGRAPDVWPEVVEAP